MGPKTDSHQFLHRTRRDVGSVIPLSEAVVGGRQKWGRHRKWSRDRIYDLTGVARLWNAVWHGPDRVSQGPPTLEHPLGDIELRVSSAYLATLAWQGPPHKLVAQAPYLASAWHAARNLVTPLMTRWPHADRLRFGGPLQT